ncbi:hypothetical protein ABH931_002707 [Streptacidiphilus sp. MAP12-33]|uniref:hypothetical protein n=1 Tax=Streptacidiphilus sp. MAP12-33 TaxID=3156266 RepID=UPI0035189F64
MSVSVTLDRTGTATWGLAFSRDGQAFAVGTVEHDGDTYNAYASPDERTRGCELVGSALDLEGAVTSAVHFFITGLHHLTARHYAGTPGSEADEDLTGLDWTT